MLLRHNSLKSEFRDPFGAAECGSSLYIHAETDDVSELFFCFRKDGKDADYIPMDRADGGFSLRFSLPEEAGLYFYCFFAKNEYGGEAHFARNCDPDSPAKALHLSEFSDCDYWQLMIYEISESPQWYKNALFYQIFPDRFSRGSDWKERVCASERPQHFKGPGRLIVEKWSEEPFYLKNERGKIAQWPFWCGTLKGVEEKLGYLESMGFTGIYLNPILAASSNHRYDTADYMRIDPLLGTEEDFASLCRAAHERGMHIVLDGVFNHTGADSLYFDIYNNYGGGACSDENSPYRSWYRFGEEYSCGYDSWWGVADLPNVNESETSYEDFICGENGVIRHWLDLGADGFRLDVADELPDSFIRRIRECVKSCGADKVLIGEVWEDASNKISYGERRMYFEGRELDAVMNYPLREVMLSFMNGEASSSDIVSLVLRQAENYPPEAFWGNFNNIGTHDRERVLTLMQNGCSKDSAVEKLKALAVLLYALPGVPCVYYGDEAGCEGTSDPYNRGTYPWGRENTELLNHFKALGNVYRSRPQLRSGAFRALDSDADLLAFCRGKDIAVAINRSLDEYNSFFVGEGSFTDVLSGAQFKADDGGRIWLAPLQAVILSLSAQG